MSTSLRNLLGPGRLAVAGSWSTTLELLASHAGPLRIPQASPSLVVGRSRVESQEGRAPAGQWRDLNVGEAIRICRLGLDSIRSLVDVEVEPSSIDNQGFRASPLHGNIRVVVLVLLVVKA